MPPSYPKPSTPPTTDRTTEEPDRSNELEQKKNHVKKQPSTTTHHHHRYSLSSEFNYEFPNQQRLQNSALRKYIALAVDAIAIRFTRIRDVNNHIDPSEKYPITQFHNNYLDSSVEVLDGLAVFNSFKSQNKKCYWNAQLSEAILSLEYKGHVHPSTILVSTSTRNMNVLRNAWARRILRDPPGYRADFLGEIEEIVAQKVQQGQFAPLSDSLCWAIAELTEQGQEAFINSIQQKLETSYPQISQPPRDLIFQTLEKLIRQQAIYQTSRGYYVVTPDISSYINYSRSVTPAGNMYGRIYSECFDRPSISRYSTPWSSTPSVTTDQVSEEVTRILSNQRPNIHLKRHNSLKIIRSKQENYHIHNRQWPSMGARSLSFRLSKCNSLFESDKESSDDDEQDNNVTEDKNEYTDVTVVHQKTVIKKRPSLLTRLFQLTCTKKQKPTWTPPPKPPSPAPSSTVSGIYASITTQKQRRSRSTGAPSLYDLITTTENSWTSKHDSSDLSR